MKLIRRGVELDSSRLLTCISQAIDDYMLLTISLADFEVDSCGYLNVLTAINQLADAKQVGNWPLPLEVLSLTRHSMLDKYPLGEE